MWYVATSATVANGSPVVAINNGDDISNIQEKSALVFEDGTPVEVVKAYLDGSGNKFVQLARAWPYASKTNSPLVVFPTDADFAAATAELKRVIDTLQIASTVEAQQGTDDEKIMTPKKVDQAIAHRTGTAAARNITTSSTDSTAGRVTKVGDFGVGGNLNTYSSLDVSTDLNDVRTTGFYSVTGSPNSPTPLDPYSLQVIARADILVTQVAFLDDAVLPKVYIRSLDRAVWSDWQQVILSSDVLRPINQGGLIERGSNANGEYVKFLDGTAIINRAGQLDLSIGSNQDFTPPISLVSNNSYTAGQMNIKQALTTTERVSFVSATCFFSTSVWRVNVGNVSSSTIDISLSAFGRWK